MKDDEYSSVGGEVSTKEGAVWNILKQAASKDESAVANAGDSSESKQIIYITYEGDSEAKDTGVHIVTKKETVRTKSFGNWILC